ncbi:MAG: putative metal-binding motif-containing protein [Myxococcota bacterium]|nr:putative metal-binding motif-containing protein [Myxococcota bacterium]
MGHWLRCLPVLSVVFAMTLFGCSGKDDGNAGEGSLGSESSSLEDTSSASSSDEEDSESEDSLSASGSASDTGETQSDSDTGSQGTGDDTQTDSGTGTEALDADSDGWLAGDKLDCNDSDSSVNPGAPEQLGNGVDDDCDGKTDENALAATGQDRRERPGRDRQRWRRLVRLGRVGFGDRPQQSRQRRRRHERLGGGRGWH